MWVRDRLVLLLCPGGERRSVTRVMEDTKDHIHTGCGETAPPPQPRLRLRAPPHTAARTPPLWVYTRLHIDSTAIVTRKGKKELTLPAISDCSLHRRRKENLGSLSASPRPVIVRLRPRIYAHKSIYSRKRKQRVTFKRRNSQREFPNDKM